MPLTQRRSGVLLHLTSLPGPHGIGDLGADAHRFVDWLFEAGQTVWQLLPTTPVGPGYSPYQSLSAFAGSPLMVALQPLRDAGWLGEIEVPIAGFGSAGVDFSAVVPWRLAQLRAAAVGFFERTGDAGQSAFRAWCVTAADWLDDYTLFMALETENDGRSWWEWPSGARRRDAAALAEARERLAGEIDFWCFVQWCFEVQWKALMAHAAERDVLLMGDLPIFIAHHSADCWARPDLYQLDGDGQPTVVAGVPPDLFSAEGQRWGNPLYRWDRMRDEDYDWWMRRLRRAMGQADLFRIDHFRGFAGYWEVPATSPTAIEGRWVDGPGKAVFDTIESRLGRLPIVAEDLGVITDDVVRLRDGCGFPGMKILQFAFSGDAGSDYLPHRYPAACVVYTGTHDNDTTRGWWEGLSARERVFVETYAGPCDAGSVHWALIRLACDSVARTALFPLQDVLGLDGAHRMNRPGSAAGNWGWRFTWDQIQPEATRALGSLTAASGRGRFELLRPVAA